MSTPIVQTSQHILNTVTRAIPTFSEAIHSLLLRKDIHRPEKISKDPPTCTALLHPNTIQQLATAFNIQHEWLADPLTHCPYIQNYTSTDPDDIAFGASTDPYHFKWTGSGLCPRTDNRRLLQSPKMGNTVDERNTSRSQHWHHTDIRCLIRHNKPAQTPQRPQALHITQSVV